MQKITVALVQLAWNGSREGMKTQYQALLAQAVARGAALVCLPEFSLLPYFPGTRDHSGFDWAESATEGDSTLFFNALAKQHGVNIIASMYEKTAEGQYYDTATLHGADGRLLGITRKVHIPSGEGYHETDFFKGYHEYPVFDLGGLRLAAPTCYDQWFPELARIYSMNGAEFIFYPTAIGSEPNAPGFDSRDAWQTVMRGHAVANGVFIGAANRVGQENQVTFYGSSFICDPLGNILAQAERDTTQVISATLDRALLAQYRQLFPLLHQRATHTYGRLLERDTASEPPAWLGK